MNSLELLKKRIMSRGSTVDARMSSDKLKTLEKALLYSYQAETIEKDGVEYRALINNNKLKMDYDDKIISIPFSSGFDVGTIFYWGAVEQHWIVYLRMFSEDAYFRGYIRKAQHKMVWEDEFGVTHETYAAVRGPVETKVVSELKSGISFDKPNYTLSIIVPYNEETAILKRYSKVAIQGKTWGVAVADSISEPGVIDVQLIEEYINIDEDNNILNPDNNSYLDNIKVKTSLDEVKEMELYEPFKLWALVEKEGVLSEALVKDAKFTSLTPNAVITENFLSVIEPPGLVRVKMEIPKLKYEKIFEFEAMAISLPAAKQYVIIGDENVKSFGKAKYEIKHFIDGVEVENIRGKWKVEKLTNSQLFSIELNTYKEIEFKWVAGMYGSIKLSYVLENGEVVASKDISVKSLI